MGKGEGGVRNETEQTGSQGPRIGGGGGPHVPWKGRVRFIMETIRGLLKNLY